MSTKNNIDQLIIRANINLQNKKVVDLCARLNQIWENAVRSRKLGKLEDSFIYFKRWLHFVDHIKNSEEYKTKKANYNDYLNAEKYSRANLEIKQIAKELQESEDIRTSQTKAKQNEPLQLPETPNDEPFAKAKDEINCRELYHLFTYKNVLVIDVRSSKEYEESKIQTFDKSVVHIPGDSILPGSIASSYEKQMNEDKRRKFKDRKNADVIVLMDQSSNLESLKSDSPLARMKLILEKWETEKLNNIVVLDGGYHRWVNTYPRYTTNPNIQSQQENALDEILESVNYSNDWLNDEELSPIKPKTVPNNANKSAVKSVSVTKNISDMIINNTHSNMQPKVILNKVENSTPTIDRTTKPNINAIASVKAVKNYILLMERIKVSKNLIRDYYTNIVKIMKQLYAGHETIENSTSEKLRDELMKLMLKKEQEEKSMEKYNEQLEQCNSVDFNKMQKQSLIECINEIEEVEQSIKTLAIEYEEIEKLMIKKANKEEWTSHKEPLKSDSDAPSSGLKRSHSSPNLVQPPIDRMTKPQLGRMTRTNEYNLNRTFMAGNREQRMEPVYCVGNHPGITGLKNLGNSCYMNSIIQCLSNTSALATYFNSNEYIHDLNNKSNEGGTPRGQIAEEVAQVIMALWRGKYKSISPRDLKVVSGQYKLQFESYDQQDSHEFLMFLLEYMHNDLKTPAKNRIVTTKAQSEWAKAMHDSESVISNLFFGMLQSTITCATCSYSSINYEIFNSLTLSLTLTNKCTLDECIENYVKRQKIIGWKCLKCKTPRDATKKFDFVKLAPVIVIHLNRFGDTGGWLEKKNTAVEFPLTDFNMRPYMAKDCTNNAQNYEYDLYAMSNHYGTMDGGHYTAYCKSNSQNKWYKYDDQTVSDVPHSIVKKQSNSAYLLFYMQNKRDLNR